jgi:hypothetical protein
MTTIEKTIKKAFDFEKRSMGKMSLSFKRS